MNKKSSTDTSFADFKKRFPTPKDFVEWMLANPDRGVPIRHEDRAAYFDRLQRESRGQKGYADSGSQPDA